MRKSIIILSLFLAQSALALPIVCESHEKTSNLATLRVKINKKVPVQHNGLIWDMHVLGVTAQEPGNMRHRLYSTGGIRKESLHMTIVKDGFVYGYVSAESPESNGIYEGKIRIGGILKSRIIDVRCVDEEIHSEVTP